MKRNKSKRAGEASDPTVGAIVTQVRAMLDGNLSGASVAPEIRQIRARHPGTTMKEAIRKYRVDAAWKIAESAGYVHVVCEPEFEPIETFEPDWKGLYSRDCDRERARKEWLDTIERDGIWMYATEYRLSLEGSAEDYRSWETADNIGGVEGDWKGTGYDVDLKAECLRAFLEAFDAETSQGAAELAARATYAVI